MRNLLSQLLAVGPELAAFILTSPLLGSRGAYAITQTAIPSPDLDLNTLGRVALAGDFDSISLYEYAGQNENVYSNNGSQSLLTRYPDGNFQSLALADAYIETMCPFVKNNVLQGVVLGGNFTSIGGTNSPSAALYDPGTGGVTALSGLSGKVSTVYCDADSGIVYFGGMFTGLNSSNAMTWTTNWTNLPFEGFNGPVTSITKNSAGNIVFGGTFDGLSNSSATESDPNGQVINLAGGNVTSNGTASLAGFDDPTNIICQTGTDGPGNTWLVANASEGYWQGNYSYGFNPSKLRLYNTNFEGRGTKTFYFKNLNSGGILNLQYLDSNDQNQSCQSVCPLAQGNNVSQDYYFEPTVGMDAFRIYLTDWYGDGAGLSGIELFTSQIYSFAINDFNEPKCDSITSGSSSTVTPATGLWERITNNGTTSSDYLSALISQSELSENPSIVFTPQLPASGNYTISIYTPGCQADDTCSTRGMVNITGTLTSNTAPVSTIIYQTNDYEGIQTLFSGYVDIDSGSFSPSITLAPISSASFTPQTIVAQRVGFDLLSTTSSGLNGLFEYNPNEATVNTNFSSSLINTAGTKLNSGASIASIVAYNDDVYVGGTFSGDGMSNIMSIGSNATALPAGGLNAAVTAMNVTGSTLYIAGNFTNTADNSSTGLNNIASFDLNSSKWVAMGAGVNGAVNDIVPLTLNISGISGVQDCISITGTFTSVNAYGTYSSYDTDGFAIWVPSKNDWINNIAGSDIALLGRLVAETTPPGYPTLFAGQISSQGLGVSGTAELVGSGQPQLQALGVDIQASNATSLSLRKRALQSAQSYAGVYTGLFYSDNSLNVTVLGGDFSASASNGSTVENLVFINETSGTQTVTGLTQLNSSSTIRALATSGSSLFAGGSLLVVYDLAMSQLVSPQPPALQGENVTIYTIATQPSSSNVYVGGVFQTAGSLACATLCFYDTSTSSWNGVGPGLSGTITSMFWASKDTLIIAGDLTINNAATTLASYNAKKQTWSAFTADTALPGPITSMTPVTGSSNAFWAAGTATANSSAFLALYSNSRWTGVSGLGASTTIRGLDLLGTTSDHASSTLVAKDQVLMISGNIDIPSYGNASAVLFNGTDFTPFILTSSSSSSSQGSLAGIFVSNPSALLSTSTKTHLAVGFVVLIGLAIALGLIFLLVVAGILIERARRRREGYVPMTSFDRGANSNLARIPPETLLGGLEREKAGAPKV